MTYLHLFQTIAQNVGTSVLIHIQRGGKSEYELAKKKLTMSLVALIKLAFLHSKSRVLKTLRAAF